MNISQRSMNQHFLTFGNGTIVLFSYQTPVAAFIPEKGYVKTDKHYSVTTSRHINQWVKDAAVVPQSFIDNLVGSK